MPIPEGLDVSRLSHYCYIMARFLVPLVGQLSIVVYLLLFWSFPQVILAVDSEAVSFIEMLFPLEFLFGHASVGTALAASTWPDDGPAHYLFLFNFSS